MKILIYILILAVMLNPYTVISFKTRYVSISYSGERLYDTLSNLNKITKAILK